ncbi:LIM and calponin homology domains-containing protein 1 isoform X4 [Astyanax mexicanus]|uniref:LIM and calponin homology domains-containing protein 1 isoform X4 n=1 Tax=Astyanax mexicanus TaxID=7994 RepID=UPI0020CB43AF|nr:LIM and calponin homology domains-containing protein 1 isoform X4 [Astyanax mexicanus]
MASPGAEAGRHLHLQQLQQQQCAESASEPAVRESQRWIEAVTGRNFGEKDFRGGLDNGILLCELLSSIKPGLVKKINRLPTPVAGLDNLALFLRGCEELGLKGSQLFDPGDLQDTRTNNKSSDCNRKLKNVLITIYWLGRAANSSATYNGPTLDLREFEGLLSQMRKEGEDWDSPKRSIRDSGYIDCWESERSESLSPPRHARDDSFDSLDSIGSRSRHTPSPDGLLARGSSDGRGSDSECDIPHRKLPDMRRDDMLARRTSCSEPRTALPFNQYLPNKSNQTTYMPTPLRRQRTEREDNRKSWSNATSPIGGERPFSESHCLTLESFPSVTSVDPQYVDLASEDYPSKNLLSEDCHSKTDSPLADTKLLPKTPQTRDSHPSVSPSPPSSETQESECTEDDDPEEEKEKTSLTPIQNLASTIESPLSTVENGEETDENSISPKTTSPTQLNDTGILHHESSTTTDIRSMSMIDMRNEEDTMLPPHSQVRHELMHGQYTRMKEEESHWQDDLARWKSRRRSVSQDLIKKEEERKMMEKLLNKEDYTQRRKSIKTYREIVQDKERREHELHDAYLRARTPEEAAAVLERYAQRFTISEAVLERLKLPKLLERSVSADPTRLPTSPTTPDPFTSPSGPLQYLRQQSLPTPKFTATVEARVTGYGAEQGEVRGSSRPSHSGRSGPFHAPTPYGQGKAVSTGSRSAKRDEMERVNGEAEDGHSAREEEREQDVQREREREEDSSPLVFYPSLSQNTGDSDSTEHSVSETPLSDRYTTSHTLIHTPETECVERADPQAAGQCEMLPEAQSQEEEEREKEQTPSRPTSLPTLPAEVEEVPQTRDESSPQKEEEPGTEALQESEQCPEEQTGENTELAVISQNGTIQTPEKTQTPTPIDTAAKEVRPVLESPQRPAYKPKPASPDQPKHKTVCEPPATELDNSAQLTPLSSNPKLRWDFFTSSEPAEKQHGNVAPAVLNLVKRGEHFSWDPEEERKRQERWQQEQERMLQEKYRREQEKLKQEWEKAQKEVEEEERRYHEEERKILEETVAPLTPHSPIPPSPCWQETTPLCGSPAQHSIVRSLADWERRQEELEKQTTGTTEKRQREKERSEATGTKQELSWSTGSPQQQSSDQQVGQPNGQREGTGVHSQESEQQPPSQSLSWSDKTENQQQSSDSWQKSGSLDCNRNIQPATAGRRRSVSGKKLCSSCGHPLGKGAAMIIETLSLYFHIQCFKCGICKGQLGDTTTGTDVRIRNGLLNCHQCYIRSRSAGQPTTL